MAELNFPGTIRSGAKENGVLVPIVYAEETFDKSLRKFQSAINSEFQNAISNLKNRKIIKIEDNLPLEVTEDYKNVLILVPTSTTYANPDTPPLPAGVNQFTEYIWNEQSSSFEEIGTIQTTVDLTNYYTKGTIDQKVTLLNNTITNKVNALKAYTYDESTGVLTLTGFNS